MVRFLWAAAFATIRISDELPKDWEQKSFTLIGVVSTLPEVTERGERFQFDVKMVLTEKTTQTLKVPRRISLNNYRETQTVKSEMCSINLITFTRVNTGSSPCVSNGHIPIKIRMVSILKRGRWRKIFAQQAASVIEGAIKSWIILFGSPNILLKSGVKKLVIISAER